MCQILLRKSARLLTSTSQDSLKAITQLSNCSSPIVQRTETAKDRKPSSLPPFKRLRSSNAPSNEKILTMDNINPRYIAMEYAVRGPLPIRAIAIETELKEGAQKPFTEILFNNLGDPHALGQKPFTYIRQLLAMVFDTSLLEYERYPDDMKRRACEILTECRGNSIGAYTHSSGIPIIRKQVAKFLEKRDCAPSNWTNIYLTNGVTSGVQLLLNLISCQKDGKPTGVMIPIPIYPLYTGACTAAGLETMDYYLDEDNNWSLNIDELKRAYGEGKCTSNPRALVAINPGNPTGQVLTRDGIEAAVKFAYENRLVILADEVYQDNVHAPESKFHSFKKVMHEMGPPYRDMELFSFMSASKGILSECGIRGGFMEAVNICPEVLAVLEKSLTTKLCSTSAGQVAVSAMVNAPQPNEPSYPQYLEELTTFSESLKERAELVYNTMSCFEGFKINPIQGAMYAFPQITIPAKAIEAAKVKNQAPDEFYAFELLEATGICVVNGGGFKQKPGTYHFRTTILPPIEKVKIMLEKFQEFHADFMQKYK